LDIHKPKPFHNLREFLGEIAVVVLGILIAIGLEQLVEHLRWEQAVQSARASLHREMAFNAAYLRDRMTIAPCVDRRIALASALTEAAAKGRAASGSPLNVQGTGRLLLRGEWEAERASQTLTHFPRPELAALGVWYDQLENMREWAAKEQEAWAKLAVLNNGPKQLGPADVALLRQEVEVVRYLEWLHVRNARRQLDRARELGVEPGPAREDYVKFSCEPSGAGVLP
jgi:hypothetical protein